MLRQDVFDKIQGWADAEELHRRKDEPGREAARAHLSRFLSRQPELRDDEELRREVHHRIEQILGGRALQRTRERSLRARDARRARFTPQHLLHEAMEAKET